MTTENDSPTTVVEVTTSNPPLFDAAVTRFRATEADHGFVTSPGSVCFVAIANNDEPISWCWGFHLVRPDNSSMLYLHDLVVAESSRRSGIGRSLLDAFCEKGRHLGAKTMFLMTGADNRPARGLYERAGATLAAQGQTVSYWFDLEASNS